MSRGGRINLARLKQIQRQKLEANSAVLVKNAIRDMQGDCNNSLTSFFLESVEMTLTSPIKESLAAYESEISREGALRLGVSSTFEDEFKSIHLSNVRFAQEKGIQLPPVLVDQPPFVTREALQVQRDLSGLLNNSYMTPIADELANQMQSTISKTQASYDMACIVAGCHLDDPQHPIFNSVPDLMDSLNTDTTNQIQTWVKQVKEALHQQATDAWALTALGAAKVALEMTGFDISEVDLSRNTITAHNENEPIKKFTVNVDSKTAALSYDLSGFKGRTCDAVEKQFVTNFEVVLGVQIPGSSRISQPKLESNVLRNDPPITDHLSNVNVASQGNQTRIKQ